MIRSAISFQASWLNQILWNMLIVSTLDVSTSLECYRASIIRSRVCSLLINSLTCYKSTTALSSLLILWSIIINHAILIPVGCRFLWNTTWSTIHSDSSEVEKKLFWWQRVKLMTQECSWSSTMVSNTSNSYFETDLWMAWIEPVKKTNRREFI